MAMGGAAVPGRLWLAGPEARPPKTILREKFQANGGAGPSPRSGKSLWGSASPEDFRKLPSVFKLSSTLPMNKIDGCP